MERVEKIENELQMRFSAISENESFARMSVAVFMAAMNPTLEEIEDVKTAVSEAVTNVVVHAKSKEVFLECKCNGEWFEIEIRDDGVGIEDVETARQPFYTTKENEERSGMGFVFMEAFMDELYVESKLGEGTTIQMKKMIASQRGES